MTSNQSEKFQPLSVYFGSPILSKVDNGNQEFQITIKGTSRYIPRKVISSISKPNSKPERSLRTLRSISLNFVTLTMRKFLENNPQFKLTGHRSDFTIENIQPGGKSLVLKHSIMHSQHEGKLSVNDKLYTPATYENLLIALDDLAEGRIVDGGVDTNLDLKHLELIEKLTNKLRTQNTSTVTDVKNITLKLIESIY